MTYVEVDGDRLVVDGETVVLRGFGLGGWLNMENFITGYAGAESQMRRAVVRVLGEEVAAAWFDRLLTVFFDDADAAYLQSLGVNSLRIPFNYRHLEDDARPFELREEGFAHLDRVIDACARHGIYTILDLHALPGAQNQHWHSDNPTQWAHFWSQRQFQDRTVWLWERIAERYRDQTWVAGYNPVNEPGDAHGTALGPFYRRLGAAIRAVDPHHVLFLDGNRYSTQFDQLGDPLPNSVYTAHDYALPGFVDGGPYPGETRGQHVDRAAIEQTFLDRTAYMRETGTPIWVGEFGPVYTGDPERDEQRYRLLQDQIEIYAEHGASWALWTYKDIGLQGLVHADPGSDYLRRLQPVLEKKARLGVDAWGSTDAGVRDVLAPLEDLVAREFPDFQPYPWGMTRWLHGHVRHVVLAEAMVDEYAAALAGLDADGARDLADAFALPNAQVRTRLADIIRASAP